ncbi:fimbrial protein [Nostoc sp. FACHB-152]|uniref:PAP/fibrillin family protein n=1 Tax=unclassified Nostoc TaxID=2593658 RepID=UPI0016866121|nr:MULTISPECIES: PAP/fibrillin family protein [unclassified Nostoc]MBD2448817.1 fimbrial protein [Nostoc sp. FACHB-152]MBD2467597.1 fimbrial protein [Nostoc sp. FACHB-145]
MVVDIRESQSAKQALRQALAACGGNTKDEAVIAAIENLCRLNPKAAPTQSALQDGKWLLISAPNFPGGEKLPDGRFVYTLGRLAFNMFEPTKLKVNINRVLQSVLLLENGQQRTHDIDVEFTTIDESVGQIKGIVRNLGICQPFNATELQANYTGGILKPHPSTKMADWQAVFRNQQKPSATSWKEKLTSGLLKLMFGLVPAKGMNPETGEITFSMKRSPKGRLAILYLDEELRITRGEKGTVLVCERLNES